MILVLGFSGRELGPAYEQFSEHSDSGRSMA